MTNLPPGWTYAPVGDLGVEVREVTKTEPNRRYELWSVPSFSAGEPEILEGASIHSPKLSVRPFDVLVCKINPRINRVWLVTQPRESIPQIASPEWFVLRLPGSICSTLAP